MTKTRDLANLIADSKVGPSEIDTTGTYNMNALQVGGNTVIDSSRGGALTSLALTGNATFADNGKAIFGAGSDLQIYHDGSNSYINDGGIGSLKIRADQLRIESADGSETLAVFNQNSDVFLRHDNTTRLATTSTGVDITGVLSSDGLTVGDVTQASNAIIKTQVDGSDVGDFDSGLQMRSHNNDFGGTIALESRTGINDVVAFKYHNNSTAGIRAMAIDATNGDITFYDNSGNAKFFWDASAEGLGVGYDPTVATDTALSVSSLTGGVGTNPVQQWKYTNDNNTMLRLRQIVTSGLVKHTFDVKNAGTDYNNNLVLDRGNVGINNSSPNTKLDIIGSSTNGSGVVDTLRLRNTGTTLNDGPRLQFTSGTSTSGAAIASLGKALNSADLVFYAGGNTERMRITSTGELLVGTADLTLYDETNGGETGFALRPDGRLYNATQGNTSAIFNRLGTGGTENGTILQLRSNGSTVGSIASRAGVVSTIVLNPAGTDGAGLTGGTDTVAPTNGLGAVTNGELDLGFDNGKFRDLYLSGGVVFGDAGGSGTSSSNSLDSYEEGTWTPVVRVGSVSGTAVTLDINNAAFYTKIGNLVFINAQFRRGDATAHGGNLYVTGLPFTSKSGTANPAGNMWLDNVSGDVRGIPYVGGSGTSILGIKSGDTDAFINVNEFDNGRWIYVTATYQT